MKLFTALSVVAGLGLALSSIPASAAINIVGNPGFETGTLGPWFQGNNFDGAGTDWSVTNAVTHSGSFAATNIGNREIRQNFTATATSLITDVSFWEQQSTASGLSAYTFYYSDNTTGQFTINPTNTWQQFDVTASLAAGKSLTGFSIYGRSGGTISYLDDVSILANPSGAVPEPSSTAAFTVGLLGLGALSIFARRRRRSAN